MLAVERGGSQEPRMQASPRGCKRQGNAFSPGTSRIELSPCSTLIFNQQDPVWISNLQNCKIINSWGIFLSHYVCGNLLHQQQETDASDYSEEEGFGGEGSERRHQRTLILVNWEFLQEYHLYANH